MVFTSSAGSASLEAYEPLLTPVVLEVEDNGRTWLAPVYFAPALTPQGVDRAPTREARERSTRSSFSHLSNPPLPSSRTLSPAAQAPAQRGQLEKPLPPLPGCKESQPRKGLLSRVPNTTQPLGRSVCENSRQQNTATDVPSIPSDAGSTSVAMSTSRVTRPPSPSSSYLLRKRLPPPPPPTPDNSPRGQHSTLQELEVARGRTMPQQESSLRPNIPPSSQHAINQILDPHTLPSGVSKYLGTEVVGIADYNPTRDIRAITQAFRFPLCQETLYKIIFNKDGKEIRLLSRDYYGQYKRRLIDDLRKSVTGPRREELSLVIRGPLGGDAHLLKEAEKMKIGDRLSLLTEMIIRREATELTLLRWFVWVTMRGIHLEEIVHRLLAERPWLMPLFDAALNRPRFSRTSSEQLNKDYDILEPIITQGVNDTRMYEIILHRPSDHLRQLCARYQREHSGETVANRLKKRFQVCYIKDVLVYAIQSAEVDPRHPEFGDGIWRDMKRIKDAILNRQALIWRLVRAHWDKKRFRRIKDALATSSAAKNIRGCPLISMTE